MAALDASLRTATPDVAAGEAGPADTAAHAKPPRRASGFDRHVVSVLGLPFDICTVAEAVERLRADALSNTRCWVSTPNLNFLIAAQSDAAFRDSVLRSDLSLADGAPIVRIARFLGLPLHERVAGATVFEALRAHPGTPLSVYFFGGPEGAAAAACARLNATRSGLHCVGFDPGGFGSVEQLSDPATIARINASGAHFVVVSLGAKKGQAWLERNADALHAPLLCHLGAVVNFVATTISRAPRWVQRADLEWLWRIKEEPALWRRYLGDGRAAIRLGLGRLLPQRLRLRQPSPRQPAVLRVAHAADGVAELHLAGAWTQADLAPLRHALQDAAAARAGVTLSMHEMSWADGAFVGLLMLAHGQLGAGNLRIRQASPIVRSILRYNAAEYLLDPASESRPALGGS